MDPNVRWDRREERGNWSKPPSDELASTSVRRALARAAAGRRAATGREAKHARYKTKMVRPRRLELPRACAHSDLNAARLPIPPRPHTEVKLHIRRVCRLVKGRFVCEVTFWAVAAFHAYSLLNGNVFPLTFLIWQDEQDQRL